MFDKIFRFNSQFTLTPFSELSEEHQKRFADFMSDDRFYGVLIADKIAKLTIKAVNRDLADFLARLRQPQRIADVLKEFPSDNSQDREQFIIQLVLDGVLEVQSNGEFISGVEAVNRVLLGSTHSSGFKSIESPTNTIHRASERSLYFAFISPCSHPRDISFILYNYNRIPLCRQWCQRIPHEEAFRVFLDLDSDDSWPGMPNWVNPQPIRTDEHGRPDAFDLHWRSWKLKGRKKSRDIPSYKVYFSPAPEALPAVFREVREAAAHSDAHAMKLGRNLPGILRPDKFIVYFPSYAPARDFARDLSAQLTPYPAHGTPFSYQVSDETALVTMGVDPPPRFGEKLSWRFYIANKLALAIQGIRRTNASDPREYIHSYMHLMGVDSSLWRPINDNWMIEFKIEEKIGANAQTHP
jgi:hypothetical protein